VANYSDSVTEAAIASDQPTSQAAFIASRTEAAVAADSPTGKAALNTSVSEAGFASDQDLASLLPAGSKFLTFKSGQLVFRNGRLFFGPPCCNACLVAAPTCVVLRRTDFQVCGGCGTVSGTPSWDGRLAYTGSQWQATFKYTPKKLKIQATITVSGSTYTLAIVCDSTTNVWTGTRTGTTPVGQYTRTSGCDTSPSMFVC
jgi:hypothetical protein